MNGGQYEGILNLLVEIRDRMPERERSTPESLTVHHVNGTKTVYPGNAGCGSVEGAHNHGRCQMSETHPGNQGARQELATMLQMLDRWIQQGKEDHHHHLEHWHENQGEECWRTFAPDDIRNMVNGVARELGLAEFPMPTEPEEDNPL